MGHPQEDARSEAAEAAYSELYGPERSWALARCLIHSWGGRWTSEPSVYGIRPRLHEVPAAFGLAFERSADRSGSYGHDVASNRRAPVLMRIAGRSSPTSERRTRWW